MDLQACLAESYDPRVDQAYIPCSQPHVAQELIVAPAIGTLRGAVPRRHRRPGDASVQRGSLGGRAAREGHVSVKAYYPKNADAWASGERTADCWVTADAGVLPPSTATSSASAGEVPTAVGAE